MTDDELRDELRQVGIEIRDIILVVKALCEAIEQAGGPDRLHVATYLKGIHERNPPERQSEFLAGVIEVLTRKPGERAARPSWLKGIIDGCHPRSGADHD